MRISLKRKKVRRKNQPKKKIRNLKKKKSLRRRKIQVKIRK